MYGSVQVEAVKDDGESADRQQADQLMTSLQNYQA
jgi:hypothetical protein